MRISTTAICKRVICLSLKYQFSRDIVSKLSIGYAMVNYFLKIHTDGHVLQDLSQFERHRRMTFSGHRIVKRKTFDDPYKTSTEKMHGLRIRNIA